MPIRQLPQSLVNRIAAGEVIERPASVVKELLENAVDAGATRIDVAVERGGLDLVRVVDNGGGIPAEELPLAVASHATSKLPDDEALFHVATLGFRGEALASIGEVSRLVLRSRPPQATGGAEIELAGGQLGQVAPCGCPPGTSVEVRNLFFNTPVRRKFLRSVATEFGHVQEAFTRVALARPDVHFTLRHNDRAVFELPGGEGLIARVARLFGRELADGLMWVESADGDVRLSGYAAHPGHSRSNNRMQYLFLNGRYIRDRALQHALGEAYRGLLMVGRYPVAFLTIDMPPDLVDVNVHPTKLEVRFLDSGRLYSQLLAALRSKFLTTDLTTRVGAAGVQGGGAEPGGGESAAGEPLGVSDDDAEAEQLRRQLVDWAKGKVAAWQPLGAAADNDPEATDTSHRAAVAIGRAAAERRPLELRPLDPAILPRRPPPDDDPPHGAAPAAVEALDAVEPEIEAPPRRLGDPRPSALQVHNRYLVTETDEGVTIIDQHALHERILYEHLRRRIESGPIETQSLLVPEPVDLTPAEAAAAMEHRELLGRLGLAVESFGGGTVLVTGFPAMLANLPPAEILRGLLEQLVSGVGAPERRDLLDAMLHTIACKAAIKAGDRLTPQEISVLLEQRHLVDDAHHCPHGRPTALVFTREELDRRFKRV
jgi:DNA mismatch repair protein MutL